MNRNEPLSRMREISRRSVVLRSASLPEARPVRVFSRATMLWLWICTAAGGALGLVFGWLPASHRLTVYGWEGLYSMTPVTFGSFWFFAGCALGILAAAVRNLFAAVPGVPFRETDTAEGQSARRHGPARREQRPH